MLRNIILQGVILHFYFGNAIFSSVDSLPAPVCLAPNPWTFRMEHLKKMFDARTVQTSVHLTEWGEKEFGLGMIPPSVSHLLGYGEFSVNMTFQVSFQGASECNGVRFLLDYGTQRSCFYTRENQPQNSDVPSADELRQPGCDGVSLALLSDPVIAGVYIAKDNNILYAGNERIFSSQSSEIRMEYENKEMSERMRFFINGKMVSPWIPMNSADVALETRVFPKITFTGSNLMCPIVHEISDIRFSTAKPITCHDVDLLESFLEAEESFDDLGNSFKSDTVEALKLLHNLAESEEFTADQGIPYSNSFILVSAGAMVAFSLFALFVLRMMSATPEREYSPL
jgi:hypothetical protein